jgi:hypothetical protein
MLSPSLATSPTAMLQQDTSFEAQQLQQHPTSPNHQSLSPTYRPLSPASPVHSISSPSYQSTVGSSNLWPTSPTQDNYPTAGSQHEWVQGSAESLVGQMLECEGLRQYVEPRCLQRELSEATGLTPEQLDHAAHELIRRTASDPASFTTSLTGHTPRTSKPPFYEHLGGYGMHELKDYNRHSPVGDVTVSHQSVSFLAGLRTSRQLDDVDDDDENVYMTSV